MNELMEMLKARQGDKLVEDFAHDLGIRTSTLYAYYRGDRGIGVSVIRRLAKYFHEQNDQEMVQALSAYVLGIDFAAE
jgi:hypothetical protein